jgi:uncharacterized membrane protein YfcA
MGLNQYCSMATGAGFAMQFTPVVSFLAGYPSLAAAVTGVTVNGIGIGAALLASRHGHKKPDSRLWLTGMAVGAMASFALAAAKPSEIPGWTTRIDELPASLQPVQAPPRFNLS